AARDRGHRVRLARGSGRAQRMRRPRRVSQAFPRRSAAAQRARGAGIVSARARRRLATALESLDARTRAMLALSRLDGLSANEIAHLVEATPEQVSHDLAIAERALRSAAAEAIAARRRRA